MQKKESLARVASVYSLLERMREAELTLAHAAVNEVETAGTQEGVLREEASAATQAALLAGDRTAWSVADLARVGAQLRLEKLREIAVARRAQQGVATEAYLESRRQKEQVTRVCEQIRFSAQVQQARQAQAATDDRHLARRHWRKGEAGQSEPQT